jgi:type I restriction enzyme S subunit
VREGPEDGLPKGWIVAPLGEIVQPTRPRRRPQDLPSLPFIGMEHIEAHTMRLLGTVPASTMKSSAVHFQRGDVLYGRLRPYLNKVFCPDFEGLCSAEFIVFPKSENYDSRFIQYLLNSAAFVSFASHLNAGDRPRVDYEQIAAYAVPLAPKPEQGRIVAEIEKQFTRLDAAVAALKRVQANLKRYRAAVLKAAVEGRLVPTEAELARREGRSYEPASELLKRILAERRARWEAAQLAKFRAAGKFTTDYKLKRAYKEPSGPSELNMASLPEGWIWARWEQVGFSQNGRTFPSSEYQDSGVKLLRPGNLHASGLVTWTPGNTRCLPEHWATQFPSFVVGGNELVMNLTAQSLKDEFLGRICLTATGERCLLNQRIARLAPIETDSRYLLWMFKSSVFRKFVDGLNTGSLIQHMFTSQLADFALPLPPIAEQARMVAEIDRRLSVVDELELQVEAGLKRAERLRQGILKRAFEGKLVPQDATDEPASVLLERIRAERETKDRDRNQERVRPRRPRDKKTVTKS